MKKYYPRHPVVGDVVGVTFYDHTESDSHKDGVVFVEAFGRVASINRLAMTIKGWTCPKEKPDDIGNGQLCWSIVRSTIVNCRILEKAPSVG